MATKKRSPAAARAQVAFKQTRQTADRVLDRTSMRPAKKAYDEEAGRLVTGLGRLFKGRTRDPLDATAIRQASGWLGTRLGLLGRAVGNVLGRTTRTVIEEGYRATADLVRTIRQAASPLDDIVTMGRVVVYRHRELEALRRRSGAALVEDLHGYLTDRLVEIPPAGARISDLITQTGELVDDQSWRVDRLVRTETSAAYNAAQRDAVIALANESEFRGVMSRWTEHVFDLSGSPMDNRVGKDSLVLHGQTTRPGGVFTMPDRGVHGYTPPAQMVGKSWTNPPNRPNDRAVLTPWMSDWGVPAWIYQAGRVLPL